MKKKKLITITLVVAAAAALFSAGVAHSQFWKDVPAVVYLTKADIDAIYKSVPDKSKNLDQPAFIEDLGPYNLGVNTQHRTTPETKGPQGGIRFHAYETEVYYILDGNGTLVTQTGAMTNVHSGDYSKADTYKRLTDQQLQFNSPSGWADFGDPAVSHKVGAGDIVVIPPFTGHYLSQITGHVDYLVFRIDPYHSMPGGYINPVFRKQGRANLNAK